MIDARQILTILLYMVAAGLILYVLWWGWGKIGVPEPLNKIGVVLLVVVSMILAINFILMVFGHPLITFR